MDGAWQSNIDISTKELAGLAGPGQQLAEAARRRSDYTQSEIELGDSNATC